MMDGNDDRDLSDLMPGVNPNQPATPKKVAGYRPLAQTTGDKSKDGLYEEWGKTYDVDPNLLFFQGKQESNFKTFAKSNKGALGPAQFMPDTAREFGLRVDDQVDERTDWRKAIPAQAKLMRKLLDRTNDINLGLAGYNSGHNYSIESLKKNLVNIAETRDYVKKITDQYNSFNSLTNTLTNQSNNKDYSDLAPDFSRLNPNESRDLSDLMPGVASTIQPPNKTAPPPPVNVLQNLVNTKSTLESDLSRAKTLDERKKIKESIDKINLQITDERKRPLLFPQSPTTPTTPTTPNTPSVPTNFAPDAGKAQTLSQPRQYQKRDVTKLPSGTQYYKFEAGENPPGLEYLGISENKHYFKNQDADEFELDEKSGQIKPLGEPKRVFDNDKNEYLKSEDQTNLQQGEVRRVKNNANYIFSSDGKIREENPAKAPLSFQTKDGRTLVEMGNQENLQPGEIRIRDIANSKGGNFIAVKKGDGFVIKAENEQQLQTNKLQQKKEVKKVIGVPKPESLNTRPPAPDRITLKDNSQLKKAENQENLIEGEMRYEDESGETFIVNHDKKEVKNESLDEVAEKFPIRLVPKIEKDKFSPEAALENQAWQVAEKIAPKYNLPKSDVIEYYKVNGFRDNTTKQRLPDDRYYADDLQDTDEMTLTRADIKKLENYSIQRRKILEDAALEEIASGRELTQAEIARLKEQDITLENLSQKRFDDFEMAKVKGEVKKQDFKRELEREQKTEPNPYLANIKAKAKVGWINKDVAQRELQQFAQLKEKKQSEFFMGASGSGGNILEPALSISPKSSKEIDAEAENFMSRIIDTYGSVSEFNRREREKKLNEAARKNAVAKMSWTEYLTKSAYEPSLNVVKSAIQIGVSSTLRGAALYGKSLSRGVDAVLGTEANIKNVKDHPFYKAADSLDQFLDDTLVTDKNLQGEWLQGKLPQAIGSSLGMLYGGFFKNDPRKAIAFFSALQTGGDAYKEAVEFGASEDKAQLAGLLEGSILGPTEVVGMGDMLIRLNKGTGGSVWRKMFRAAYLEGRKEIPEEIAQEGVQTTGSNLIAQLVYDPNRKADQDLAESLLTAGVTAGLVSSAVTTINTLRNRQRIKRSIEQEEANGVVIENYGENEIKIFGKKIEITKDLKPLVESFDNSRNGIVQIQQEINALKEYANQRGRSVTEKRQIVVDIANLRNELNHLRKRQVVISKEIVEKSGVEVPKTSIGETETKAAETEIKPLTPTELETKIAKVNEQLSVQDGNSAIETNTAETEIATIPPVENSASEANKELPTVGNTITANISGKEKQGVIVEDRGNKVIVDFEDGTKTFVPKKKTQVVAKKIDDSVSLANFESSNLPVIGESNNVSAKSTPVREFQPFILPDKSTKTKHKYSTTQVNLPEEVSKNVLSFGNKLIKTQDLADKGREQNPHITAKYGLETDEVQEVTKLLEGIEPFEVTLGKTSIFRAKSGQEFDVVKIDVDSPKLNLLNKLISKNVKNVNTQSQFIPHVTLARVKPGKGLQYAGKTDFEGQKITFDKITFSDRNGNQFDIPLAGKNSNSIVNDKSLVREELEPEAVNDSKNLVTNKKTSRTFKAVDQDGREFTVTEVITNPQSPHPDKSYNWQSGDGKEKGGASFLPQRLKEVKKQERSITIKQTSNEQIQLNQTVTPNQVAKPENVSNEDLTIQSAALDIINELFDGKKPEAEKNKKVANALKDLAGIFGDDILQKSAVIPEFDEQKYSEAKNLFKVIIDEIGESQDDVNDSLRKIIETLKNDYNLTKDGVIKLVPYMSRYLLERQNALQSEKNESITKNNDSESEKFNRDGQDGDGAKSTADVRGTDKNGESGESGTDESRSRAGNTRRTRNGSDKSVGNVRTISDGADSDTQNVEQPSERDSNQSSNGIPDGRNDFIAPVGSLSRTGSWRETARTNLDILELVKKLETENRLATPEEQALLVKFTGWGASEIANNLFPGINAYNRDTIRPEMARDGWKELAQRAKDLFTPEELQTALSSTQYAHYTSEDIVRGIWDGLTQLGFSSGKILEPGMGVGLFASLAPKSVIENSKYTGIEMDKLTAAIATQILQKQNVIAGDFVKQKLPDNFFDVAIGNPPFSSTKILDDPDYKKYSFLLHDYFFAKSIDKVRPGGLLVFVTSKGTLDKNSPKMREYIADKADFLGAIRLPQTAFKQNAGTEVVTDVIFLRKRLPNEEKSGQDWIKLAEIEAKNKQGETVKDSINEYFVNNPEMVLGTNAFTGSMYRANSYTVEPLEGDISEHFKKAIEKLPTAVFAAQNTAEETITQTSERDWNPKATKEGSLYLHDDGRLMRREEGSGVLLSESENISANNEKWLKDYINLRKALKQAQYDQLNEGDWEKSLAELNRVYENFVKKNGNILEFTTQERTSIDEDGNEVKKISRRFKNQRLLSLDLESPLIYALEKITEDGKIEKSAMLLRRTIKRPAEIEIKTINDALAVSLDKLGNLNLSHVTELYQSVQKISREDVIKELGPAIYENPAGGWELADDYLSGFVIDKLEEAQTAAATDKRFERNVEALLQVQPKPLDPIQINVSLGASWIPSATVSKFANEILQLPSKSVSFDAIGHIWSVFGAEGTGSKMRRSASAEWGTADRSPNELLDAALNGKSIKIYQTTIDKKKVLDEGASAKANDIVVKMRDEFRKWIWSDAKRASELTDKYNRQFNNIAPRRFDGEHLNRMTFPGLSAVYKLHDHQKRAIWRVIQTGNTYLAHAVGAGKTLEMIVSAMEQKRLGLINKPLFVVPNHMLKQFSSEFLDAYPMANILVADEKNFHTDNRRRFVAQAALNDLDAIVITHSAFGLIRTKPENTTKIVDEMIAQLNDAISEASFNSPDERAAERTIKKLEARIETIRRRFGGKTDESNQDNVVDFEDLGVDFLYVDEAHEFRKLDFVTNREAVKGVTPEGSRRALDLLIKLNWLNSQRPGRSAVLASGTPVTNTLAELYSIQRFMDKDELERTGLSHFDAWASQFGEVVGEYEMNAAGKYELVERFSRFINIPELMKRVRKFMDVLTLGQLSSLVDLPTIKNGAPEVVVVPATEATVEYLKTELDRRIETSRKWKPSPGNPGNPDPLINIITDGRLAAIDMRFVDPEAENDPNSKLNVMIDSIIANYQRDKELEFRNKQTGEIDPVKGAGQIVFSAVGFGEAVAANRGFDAKAWMIKRLTQDGKIPANEIAFISDYKTATAKETLFQEMRQGTKRILVGSPKNMGTGVNAQKRLKTLHYLSPPWYPADVEQPDGRIIRQGNQNQEIEIRRYATKGTYDSTAWAMIARKSRAIEQAMTGDDSQRSLEDITESSHYEMASALAAGDGRAIQLAGLRREIEKLHRLEEGHWQEQRRLQSDERKANNQIESDTKKLARIDDALKQSGGYISSENFKVNLGNVTLDKRTEIGAKIKEFWANSVKKHKKRFLDSNKFSVSIPLEIKVLGKFPLTITLHESEQGVVSRLRLEIGEVTKLILDDPVREIELLDAVGLSTRIYNALNGLSSMKKDVENSILQNNRELKQIKSKIGKPFAEKQELFEKIAEYTQLQTEMAEDKETETENAAIDSVSVMENSLDVSDSKNEVPSISEVKNIDAPQKSAAEMKRWSDIVGANLGELPIGMVTELDTPNSYRIRLNAESAEFLRRVYQEIRAKINKTGTFELPFSALFDILKNPTANKEFAARAILFIRDQAGKAKNLGYSPLEILNMNNLADSIELAAKNGNGGFIIYIDDTYLPEEEFHRAGFMAFNAAVSNDRYADNLNDDPLVKRYKVRYAKYLAEFPENVRDAVAWDETAAIIARDGGAELNATEAEMVEYLARFFESIAKRLEQKGINIEKALANYDPVQERKIREQIKQTNERFRNRPRGREVKTDGEVSQPSRQQSAQVARENQTESENEPIRAGTERSDGNAELKPAVIKKTGLASLPETMRGAGYEAESKEYEVQTNADTRRAAIEMADASDAEIRILEALIEGRDLGAKDTALALELVKRLSREARNTKDARIAVAKRDKAAEIIDLLDERLRGAGQFIQAVQLIEALDPDMILATAAKRMKRYNPDAVMSDESKDDLVKKAEELEAAKIDLEKKFKRLEKKFDKYKSENKVSSKRENAERKNTVSAARQTVIKNLAKKENAIIDKYKNIFGGIVSGMKAADIPPILTLAQLDARMSRAVEDFKAGDVFPEDSIPLSPHTFALYRRLGIPNLPMQFEGNLFDKATNGKRAGHDLDIDSLKNLPSLLARPILVFDDESKRNLVSVIELKDGQGNPVVAIIHVNRLVDRGRVNFVPTINGKSNISQITDWVKKGRARYFDTKKLPVWATRHRLQLPDLVQSLQATPNILTENDFVKKTPTPPQKSAEVETKPIALTNDQINELAQLGALEMGRGFIKLGEKIFERRLREIFGDAVTPFASEIWAKSRFEYQRQLRLARKATQLNKLAEENPELSPAEVEDLYNEKANKLRNAQKTANAHLKRAKEILGMESANIPLNQVQENLINNDRLDKHVRQLALLLADAENRPSLKELKQLAVDELGLTEAQAQTAVENAIRELDRIKLDFKRRTLANKYLTEAEAKKLQKEKAEILKTYNDIFAKVRIKPKKYKKLSKLQRKIVAESEARKTDQIVVAAALMISNPVSANYNSISLALREIFPDKIKDAETADKFIKNSLAFVKELKQILADEQTAKKEKEQSEKGKKLTDEEKAEIDLATKRQSKAYRELTNRLDAITKIPVGKLAVAGHYAGRLRRIYKGLLVSAISTAFPNLYGGAMTIGTRALTDIIDWGLQKFQKRIFSKEIISGSDIKTENSFADVLAIQAFQGVVSKRMAEGILDRFPAQFERLFGRYNADIEAVGDAVKIPYLTKAFEGAEWFVDKANIFNQLQEFAMRRAEFLRVLMRIAKEKGVDLNAIWEERQVEQVFTEEDIEKAINAALESTYAMQVNPNTVVGRLVNKYNEKMNNSLWALAAPIEPAIFATFMYNAGRFATDYVPPLHIAKHLFSSDKYNTQNAAQFIVGSFFFALGLSLVRAFGGDDDRWYVLTIAGVPIDVRRYAPFAAFVYLADVANRAYEGRYPIEKWEDAVEQFFGLNTRAIIGNPFLEALSLGVRGATGKDDRSLERLGQLGASLAGRTLTAPIRPFRPLKDLAAQFIESEGMEYDYYDSPFMAELHKAIPLSSLLWTYSPKKDFVTGETKQKRLPALNILGVSVQSDTFRQQSVAEEAVFDMREQKRRETEMLPDERRRADAIRSISKANEKGIDTTEAIDRAVAEGLIKPKFGEILKRNKGKIPLEIAIERNQLTVEEKKKLLSKVTAEEKPVLDRIINTAEENRAESDERVQKKADKAKSVSDLIRMRQSLGKSPSSEQMKPLDEKLRNLRADGTLTDRESVAIRAGLTQAAFTVENGNQPKEIVESFTKAIQTADEVEKKQLITSLRLKFFNSKSIENKTLYFETIKPFLSPADLKVLENQLKSK